MPKKRGRKPGTKNGMGVASLKMKHNGIDIKVRNPEEDNSERVGKKRGRKPGSVNKGTYDAMTSSQKMKYDAK